MSFPSDSLVGNTVFLPLGLIEKPVRFHHSISDLTASIYTSHAHGKPDFFVFRHICHCDLFPDIFQLLLKYLFRDFFKHQKKFVSSITQYHVICPHMLKDRSDNGTKRRISSYMAIAVIDLFKIVHVDHSYSPHLIQGFQLFLKISPVSGTSQRIFI